jgi:hypothetical protein
LKVAARIRLNSSNRDELIKFADTIVEPKKERKALDAAYAKAKPLVTKAVGAKYPPRDMAVLRKYGLATSDQKVKLSCPNGSFVQFIFNEGDAPDTADRYDSAAFLADEATADAVEAWVDATAKHSTERRARVNAYRALIQGSTFLDQVTGVWPEAEGLIQPNRLPIALGPEQIAIIKGDVRERKVAA